MEDEEGKVIEKLVAEAKKERQAEAEAEAEATNNNKIKTLEIIFF